MSKLNFSKVVRTADGIPVQCEICETSSGEMYHNTKFKNFKDIAEEGIMVPKCESMMGCSAISFSKNPENTVGGNIRLVFERTESEKLRDMCYVVSEDRDKYDEIVMKKLEQYGSLNENMVSSKIGLQRSMFKDECEVYSEKPLVIGEDIKLKRVEAYIPWRNGVKDGWAHTTCKSTYPRYSKVQDLDKLVSEVNEVKEIARKHGIPFQVESCFPYLRAGGLFGKWYKLDEDNLARLTDGDPPILDEDFADKNSRELSDDDCRC